MKKYSKRYKKLIDLAKDYKSGDLKEIIPMVKKTSTAKFDESVDISLRINMKKSKGGGGDVNLRTVVNLPYGSGKKVKVAVICEDDKLEVAKKSGADLFGSENLINEINSGKINFDKIISTPGMMSKISKLGKVLGPKGLMPNPKLGTVTNNIKSAIESIKSGQIEIKNDKDGNIGASIGKKSFSEDKINKNFETILETISKEKPLNQKGDFILSAFLSSSMGVSYKIKLKNL